MPVSRLIIALGRSELALPDTGNIAVFRALPDFDYSGFPPDRLHLFNSFRPALDHLKEQFPDPTTVAPDVDDNQRFSLALVHITRSKAESLGLIAKAFLTLRSGGVVVVDGDRTDGIDSILKRCKALFPLQGSLAKHHGRLFWMGRPATLPRDISIWHNALGLSRNDADFLTAPGMFSPARADPGSILLAGHFDARIAGEVADLGAGWGWLAAQALHSEAISVLDLIEAEKTAIDAARANITDTRAQFHWADVRTLDAAPRYDNIICNPPFHQGRAALPALGLQFIKKAASLLKPKGALWLVANRQLPYEAGLEAHFAQTRTLEETPYFKAILATRPISEAARAHMTHASQTHPGRRSKRR